MRWLKRDRWKAGIAVIAILLVLVLMVWVPVLTAGAYEGEPGPVTPVTGTVQATPTQDATVTALNKEKLAQEVQQLKNQNEPDPLSWLRTNASIFLSTLVVVVGALFGFWRWRMDRRDAQNKELEDRKAEREKRAEERFQAMVEGLGSEREEAKVGAAIMLRTFLRPGHEQFYTQTFDLAVANLRLRNIDLNIPEPLNSLSQALITVFKESFLLARNMHKQDPHLLDAARVQLDCAYFAQADLMGIWMPEAYLRSANLIGANLRNANLAGAKLQEANLSNAQLINAILTKATFYEADLTGANLTAANLTETYLVRANFTNAILIQADFTKADFLNADLTSVNLTNANLTDADFSSAVLTEAILTAANLKGTKPENAKTLEGAKMYHVKGLTKEQLEACKAKGAIIDEDTTTSPPESPVSPVSPSPPSQSTNVQAPSAQGSLPTPDTDGSSAASSQTSAES